LEHEVRFNKLFKNSVRTSQ